MSIWHCSGSHWCVHIYLHMYVYAYVNVYVCACASACVCVCLYVPAGLVRKSCSTEHASHDSSAYRCPRKFCHGAAFLRAPASLGKGTIYKRCATLSQNGVILSLPRVRTLILHNPAAHLPETPRHIACGDLRLPSAQDGAHPLTVRRLAQHGESPRARPCGTRAHGRPGARAHARAHTPARPRGHERL